MDKKAIRDKFGDDYAADDITFAMGIDRRLTEHMAERFANRIVLETCTGAGFTTIALARMAARVTTVEIDPIRLDQARRNVARAGFSDKVEFMAGDILDDSLLDRLPAVDGALLDPDWAVTGREHVFRFIDANTRPPADRLLARILRLTPNTALILPPRLDVRELRGLPGNERERLFLDGSHELYCLYFGDLIRSPGETEFHA